MKPLLDIYKASAGSGKTFLLTIKYLLLLFNDPGSYTKTLAVTFTNKATAEMKERILDVLKWLATNHDNAKPYRRILLDELPLENEGSLQEKADLLYRAILHDYSRFTVSTIDAFVQRIVRSFAWEIGIDNGFQLQMDMDPVKEDLALRMYDRLEKDDKLRNWVVDLAAERLGEGKNWNVREDMMQLASELFKERFSGFEEGLRSLGDDDAIATAFSNLMKKLTLHIRQFDEAWKAMGLGVVEWVEQNGLVSDDFSYGNRGFIQYFFKVAKGITEKPGKRFTDAIREGGTLVSGKALPAVQATIDGWRTEFESIGNDILNFREAGFPFYAAAVAIRKNLGILRIMRVFYEELKNYRTENNKLLMSDTHLLLRQLTRDTSASFIYERTGSRYQHFLIDEFQDTSGFQWDNFRPLMENAMSEGHFNLIVGDVKQAIYRWRSGDWRLLLSEVQRELGHFAIGMHTLQDNRRSARQVIEFNNFLFYTAPQLLQNQMNNEMESAPGLVFDKLAANGYPNIFKEAYSDAVQQAPDDVQENGLVRIKFIPPKDENDMPVIYNDVVLDNLYQTIVQLLAEGYVASDLAILVRTNSEAAMIVQYLLEAQQANGTKFDLLSGDALLLANNQAIQMLVCAMQVLANHKNRPALAQLRYLNLLQQGRNADAPEVFAANGGDYGLPPAFSSGRQGLKALPLSELVHQLISIFNLQATTGNAPYLVAFQDLVFSWAKAGEQGILAFLKYWEEEGCKKSLPGGANMQAVEVITIHKSKGLAYPVVLMPFLNWKLVHDSGKAPQLWVDSTTTPFGDIPVVPVRYRSALAESAFAYDYFEEQVLCVMDNLNVLYVAFTRARQRIYGWAPWEEIKSDTGLNTLAKLLKAVATLKGGLQPGTPIDTRSGFDSIALAWTYGTMVPPAQPTSGRPVGWMPPLHYHSWQPGLKVRYRAVETEADAAARLPRDIGVLMHNAFAKLQQHNEVPVVLKQLQMQGLITETVAEKMYRQMEKIIALPVFADWRTGHCKRLAERSLLTEKRELKRPDLVLYRSGKTVVIDFKFTGDEQDTPKYIGQVQGYMQLLAKAGFDGLNGYVVYGNSLQVVEVPFLKP